jgi:CheY-like chemotaxis protein
MAKQVLVIEDEADLRKSVAEVLKLEGYEVVTAAHGEEALEELRNGCEPEVIVLDLMMPVMDGWTFRRRQREADDLDDDMAVVVFTSAKNVDEGDEDLAPDAVIEKPVAIQQLIEIVDKHV